MNYCLTKNCTLISGLLLIMSVLSSCNLNNKTQDGQQQLELHNDTVEQGKILNIEKLSLRNDSNKSLLVEYNIEYLNPQDSLATKINTLLLKALISSDFDDADFKHAVQDYHTREVNVLTNELSLEMYANGNADIEYGFYSIRNGKFINHSHDKIISYSVETNVYYGGAHGMHEIKYLNFCKKDARQIHIEDVLDMSDESKIADLLLTQLLKDNNVDNVEQLMEKTSLLTINDLYVTDNFLLGKETITFHYNPYEIGPYASGSTDITITLSSIKPYVKGNIFKNQ